MAVIADVVVVILAVDAAFYDVVVAVISAFDLGVLVYVVADVNCYAAVIVAISAVITVVVVVLLTIDADFA
jgi:hypothetical protein